MSEDFGNEYLEKREEIEEAAYGAVAYIYDGDPIYAPHDLRGLCVYGVVSALREYNSNLYGDQAGLTNKQRERLEEVELEVDKAVA